MSETRRIQETPPADAVHRLREFFARRVPDEVLAAYLFGSRARGAGTPSSDFDVGLVLEPPVQLDSRARFDLRVDLIGELIGVLNWNEVDVVILNEGPPTLSAGAITQGTLLFCRDARRLRDYVRDVQLLAADLRPFLLRMEKRLLKRLSAP